MPTTRTTSTIIKTDSRNQNEAESHLTIKRSTAKNWLPIAELRHGTVLYALVIKTWPRSTTTRPADTRKPMWPPQWRWNSLFNVIQSDCPSEINYCGLDLSKRPFVVLFVVVFERSFFRFEFVEFITINNNIDRDKWPSIMTYSCDVSLGCGIRTVWLHNLRRILL